MKVYNFMLIDCLSGDEIMSTQLDEPDPRIDFEFWKCFMERDCYMRYRGSVKEDDTPEHIYALGYYDGRAMGIGKYYLYEGEKRESYRAGYTRGVADYCEHDPDCNPKVAP